MTNDFAPLPGRDTLRLIAWILWDFPRGRFEDERSGVRKTGWRKGLDVGFKPKSRTRKPPTGQQPDPHSRPQSRPKTPAGTVGDSRPDPSEIAAALQDFSNRARSLPADSPELAPKQVKTQQLPPISRTKKPVPLKPADTAALVSQFPQLEGPTTRNKPTISKQNRDAKWAELMKPMKPVQRPPDPEPEPQSQPEPHQKVKFKGKSGAVVSGDQRPVQNRVPPAKPVETHQMRGARSHADTMEPGEEVHYDSARSDGDQNRKSLEFYYGVRPLWTLICIAIGIAFMFHPWRYHAVYGFEVTIDSAFLFGLFLTTLGVLWRNFYIARPADALVDQWIAGDMGTLRGRAHELMNLNKVPLLTEPLAFEGFPDLDQVYGAKRISRYGSDHVLRFTPRAITVIGLSQEHVVTYEGALDLTTGQQVYESVKHFFYSDIATIGLVKLPVKRDLLATLTSFRFLMIWRWFFVERLINSLAGKARDGSTQRLTREVFRISLVDGSTVNIVLRDGRFSGDRVNEEIPISGDEEALRLIREIITTQKNRQVQSQVITTQAPGRISPDNMN